MLHMSCRAAAVGVARRALPHRTTTRRADPELPRRRRAARSGHRECSAPFDRARANDEARLPRSPERPPQRTRRSRRLRRSRRRPTGEDAAGRRSALRRAPPEGSARAVREAAQAPRRRNPSSWRLQGPHSARWASKRSRSSPVSASRA
jgi:hypothetical protein